MARINHELRVAVIGLFHRSDVMDNMCYNNIVVWFVSIGI